MGINWAIWREITTKAPCLSACASVCLYIMNPILYFENIVIKAYYRITLRSHKGMAFIDVAIKYDKFKLYPVYFKEND